MAVENLIESVVLIMDVKINRLALMDTFVKIVEVGSFTEAAKSLNTSQPTVSRQLRSLEDLLGMELVRRTTHGMRVTDAGKRYYEYSRALISDMVQFENIMRGEHVEPRGSLRIIVPQLLVPEWLTVVASRYFKECPQVKLEWMAHDKPVRFHEEAVDCVIRFGLPFDQASAVRSVGMLERIVLASPDLLERCGIDESPIASSGKLPWISLSADYRTRLQLFDDHQRGHEFQIDPVFVADQILATREAARQGIGALLVPEWAVTDDIKSGSLVRIFPAWAGAPMPINIIYPKDGESTPKLARFLEVAESAIQEIFE